MMTRTSNVTYHIQAIDNPRKRKVVHFNSLNSVMNLTQWISSMVLTRLLAQCRKVQCKDQMFHLYMFLMKLISCAGMKQPMWKSQ